MSHVESCQHCADCAEVQRLAGRAKRLEGDKTRFGKLCVAAQADGFKHRCLPGGPKMVDDNCPQCDLEHEADLIAKEAAKANKRRRE